MILDLGKFVAGERRYWDELETMLDRLENEPAPDLPIEQLQRFHYLYQRSMADLAKVSTFAATPEIHEYLQSLVARAYGEAHETRRGHARFRFWRWFFQTFPQTFRRHVNAFWLTMVITLVGCVFGGLAVMLNGNMALGIVGDDLMVRTGPERFEELLERPHARPMDFSGRPMKGMVFIDPAGLQGDALRQWVDAAAGYARALPSKAARKRR